MGCKVCKEERSCVDVGNTETSNNGRNNRRLGLYCDRKFTLQSRTFHIGENSLRSRTHVLWHCAALPLWDSCSKRGMAGESVGFSKFWPAGAGRTMMRNRREHNFKPSTAKNSTRSTRQHLQMSSKNKLQSTSLGTKLMSHVPEISTLMDSVLYANSCRF